ncbi:MAG: hypothetical protein ACKO2L_11825 [Planctomycetaceae bacterium]
MLKIRTFRSSFTHFHAGSRSRAEPPILRIANEITTPNQEQNLHRGFQYRLAAFQGRAPAACAEAAGSTPLLKGNVTACRLFLTIHAEAVVAVLTIAPQVFHEKFIFMAPEPQLLK